MTKVYKTIDPVTGAVSYSGAISSDGGVRLYNVAGRLVTQKEKDAAKQEQRDREKARREQDRDIEQKRLDNATDRCEAELGPIQDRQLADAAHDSKIADLREAYAGEAADGWEDTLNLQLQANNALRAGSSRIQRTLGLYLGFRGGGVAGFAAGSAFSLATADTPLDLALANQQNTTGLAIDVEQVTGRAVTAFNVATRAQAVYDFLQGPELFPLLDNASLAELRSFRDALAGFDRSGLERLMGAPRVDEIQQKVDKVIAAREAEIAAEQTADEKRDEVYRLEDRREADQGACILEIVGEAKLREQLPK